MKNSELILALLLYFSCSDSLLKRIDYTLQMVSAKAKQRLKQKFGLLATDSFDTYIQER